MHVLDILQRMLLLHELDQPDASQRGIARVLGVGTSSIHAQVRRLITDGAVEMRGEHRQARYGLTPAGRTQLQRCARQLLLEDTPIYERVRAELDARVARLVEAKLLRCVTYGEGPALELALVAMLGSVDVVGHLGQDVMHLRGRATLEGLECDAVVSVTNDVPHELRRSVREHNVTLVFFT